MRRLRAALALFAVLVVGTVSCGDKEPAGPTAGTLYLALESPNGEVGAIRMRISGAGIANIEAAQPFQVYYRETGGDRLEVVVVGDVLGGDLLSLEVPDVDAPYPVSLIEVASRENTLRQALGAYTLRLHP